MGVLVLILVLASGLFAQTNPCAKICLASSNFSVDSYGPVDTRPSTEGHADYTVFPLTFAPPAGYRVRIVRIYGDLISWPCTQPGQVIPAGAHAGVLLSIHTRMSESSPRCDYCAGDALLYIQDGVVDHPVRTPFDLKVDRDVRTIAPAAAGASGSATSHLLSGKTIRSADAQVPGLLQPDNRLYIKVSQWMNTTGVPIHMEPTFTVAFRFEPIS